MSHSLTASTSSTSSTASPSGGNGDSVKTLAALEKKIADTRLAYMNLWNSIFPPNRPPPEVWTAQQEAGSTELSRLMRRIEELRRERDVVAVRVERRESGNIQAFANMGVVIQPRAGDGASGGASGGGSSGRK
jgi:hypothetical protein